ncbi:DoxX family membrane protein [Nocardioides sp. dk4132]|uniref:DoxX family protein n=1 Tax=unclassified Nocardioides TaxID=2615069 RepID=UPI001294A7D0|nr:MULTISPECIES: DoxX family protein [unclassified Nocardioides]MQW77628.1 DoxX family membrane protein [Nocardioides sp. dk4132]QGA06154.1 DoxX family membrane protein [Nocardioides sp. dk884]
MEAVDLTLLVVRIALGAIMIAHGLNHWLGGGKIAGTAGWFESLGLRHGVLQAWASVVTEIGAGVLLILGALTSLAAAAVVSVMLVAGLLHHWRNGFFIFKEGYEYVLLVGVVAVLLGAVGPGEISVDHAAGIEVVEWQGIAVSLGVGVVATLLLLAATWRPVRATEPVPDSVAS